MVRTRTRGSTLFWIIFLFVSFDFSDIGLSDTDTHLVVIRMFMELDFISKFRIPYEVSPSYQTFYLCSSTKPFTTIHTVLCCFQLLEKVLLWYIDKITFGHLRKALGFRRRKRPNNKPEPEVHLLSHHFLPLRREIKIEILSKEIRRRRPRN